MYRCNNNSCSCKNNCSMNKCCNKGNKAIETICDDYNSCSCSNTNNNPSMSGCGFKTHQSVFPTNPMLGQSYVPIQYMDKTFTPMCGLKNGTLFPELVNTYYPGQSMMDIDYLRMTSNIGMEV